MTVIFNDNVRIFRLDVFHNLTQRHRATNACHVFEADLVGPGFDQFVGHIGIVFDRVNRRVGYAQAALRNHSAVVSVTD